MSYYSVYVATTYEHTTGRIEAGEDPFLHSVHATRDSAEQCRDRIIYHNRTHPLYPSVTVVDIRESADQPTYLEQEDYEDDEENYDD